MRNGKHVYSLDGDNIRTGLNRDLGFSKGDRAESVRRVGELSCLFSDSVIITIVSLVSPYRADRDEVRARHTDQGIEFMEMFMDVPLDVVQKRDPKVNWLPFVCCVYFKWFVCACVFLGIVQESCRW